MGQMFGRSAGLVPEDEAPKGGSHPVLENSKLHAMFGTPITSPWEGGQKIIRVDIDYYRDIERLFWETPGVLNTPIGFAGGVTSGPTCHESRTGRTNYAEIVEVVYDPEQISFDQPIVEAFKARDPTQGYHQSNNVGTQCRPTIYATAPEQTRRVQEITSTYTPKLADAGLGIITTEVKPLSETLAGEYHRAGDEYQQYLFRNLNGYCPVHSTGVAYGI